MSGKSRKSSKRAPGRPRVFIVEDQKFVCEMLAERLSRDGFDVVGKALDFVSCLKLLTPNGRANVDILLMDLGLPREITRTFELIDKLTADDEDLQVVILSERLGAQYEGSAGIVARAIRAGAVGLCAKVEEMDSIRTVLKEVMRQRGLRPSVESLKKGLGTMAASDYARFIPHRGVGTSVFFDAVGRNGRRLAFDSVLLRSPDSRRILAMLAEGKTQKAIAREWILGGREVESAHEFARACRRVKYVVERAVKEARYLSDDDDISKGPIAARHLLHWWDAMQ